MLTEVGAFLRGIRITHGELLKTMAEKLEVSSAFLSAVENGKKKMPSQWEEKLQKLYDFSQEQVHTLQEAIIDTNHAIELNLENVTPQSRNLAISFARHFDALDEETSQKMLELLKSRNMEDNDT